MDVEKLKRELSEALAALRQDKSYLGIGGLADELEKLGSAYRHHAWAVRSAVKDAEKLKAAVSKAISKLEGPPAHSP